MNEEESMILAVSPVLWYKMRLIKNIINDIVLSCSSLLD